MLDREEFLRSYFERKPCLMRNAFTKTKFGFRDIEETLYLGEQEGDGIRLHKGGAFLDEREYTEICVDIAKRRRTIQKDKFYEAIKSGASIIFNRMESVSLPIRGICQEIGRYVSSETAANGYISIGGEQAFGNHWDTHDVFAVQLFGRKKWTIYNPTFELPLRDQRSGPFKDRCPKGPALETILEPGDVLYVPRGWWHNALALPGKPTFHIAVGVHPPRIIDYVTWLTSTVMEKDIHFRNSMDSKLSSPESLAELGERIASLFSNHEHFKTFRNSRDNNNRWFSSYQLDFVLGETPKFDPANTIFAKNWSVRSDRIEKKIKNTGFEQALVNYIISILAKDHRGVAFHRIASEIVSISHEELSAILSAMVTQDLISMSQPN